MAYDMDAVKTAYSDLTELVKIDLNEQFEKKRIKGSEYADVYNNIMNTALQLAMDAPAKAAQIDIANQELLLKQKNTELVERQIKGFDDNINQKLTEMQMQAWSTMFASGLLEEKPSIIANDSLSSLYTGLLTSINEDKSFVVGDSSIAEGTSTTWVITNFNPASTYDVYSEDTTVATVSAITSNSFEVSGATIAGTDIKSQLSTIVLKQTDTDGILSLASNGITVTNPDYIES